MIALLVFILIFSIILSLHERHHRCWSKLSKKTQLKKKKKKYLRELVELNEKYNNRFYMVDGLWELSVAYDIKNSKYKFDKHTLEGSLKANVLKYKDYNGLINMRGAEAEINKEIYELYIKEYNELPKPRKKSAKMKHMNSLKLKPVMSLDVKLIVFYRSPAGRNYYEKVYNVSEEDLIAFIDKWSKENKAKTTRQAQIDLERSKMTTSVRFDVLNRDNFTCQYCGTKATDGVKLHVDHIHPVSKGGKTTADNLITACERCNLGKSNKLLL